MDQERSNDEELEQRLKQPANRTLMGRLFVLTVLFAVALTIIYYDQRLTDDLWQHCLIPAINCSTLIFYSEMSDPRMARIYHENYHNPLHALVPLAIGGFMLIGGYRVIRNGLTAGVIDELVAPYKSGVLIAITKSSIAFLGNQLMIMGLTVFLVPVLFYLHQWFVKELDKTD